MTRAWAIAVILAACDAGQKPAPPAAPPAAIAPPPPLKPPADAAIAGSAHDFGCFAYSEQRDLVACIVGDRGVTIGPSSGIALVLVPIANDDAAVTTLRSPGSDATAGFQSLEPGEHAVGGIIYGHPWTGRLSRGGGEIVATVTPGPSTELGRRYTATLTAFGTELAYHDAPLSDYAMHVFALGDTVIVDEVYSVAGEGEYGSFANAYRCAKGRCAQIAPAP